MMTIVFKVIEKIESPSMNSGMGSQKLKRRRMNSGMTLTSKRHSMNSMMGSQKLKRRMNSGMKPLKSKRHSMNSGMGPQKSK